MRNIAMAIFLIGISLWILSLKFVNLENKRAQLEKAQERLTSLKSAATQIKLLEEEIKALEEKLPELQKALPSEADIEVLVKKFSSFASHSGVKLLSISSSRSRRLPNEDPYLLWEISMKGGSRTYDSLLSFLKRIKKMKRALEPVNMEVKFNKNWLNKRNETRLLITGKFRTFIRRQR